MIFFIARLLNPPASSLEKPAADQSMYRITHACRKRKEAKGVPNVRQRVLAAYFHGETRLFWPTLHCLQQRLSSKRCQRSIELGASESGFERIIGKSYHGGGSQQWAVAAANVRKKGAREDRANLVRYWAAKSNFDDRKR
jgi:hypothetical protein